MKLSWKLQIWSKKIRYLHEERGAINKELAVLNEQITELSKKISIDDNNGKKINWQNNLFKNLIHFSFH